MKIFTITAAFCPAAQLARSVLEYRKYSSLAPEKHIIVDCHYPINKKKNQKDLQLIVNTLGKDLVLWDPGEDLGSAQSQNWVLEELGQDISDDDVFINLDPDASCRTLGWDQKMVDVLSVYPPLVVLSCNAPMVQKFIESRHQEMEEIEIANQAVMLPDIPTPFNLSMFRMGFVRSIGGLPQKFPYYGELEGPMFAYARAMGLLTGYMKDCWENEEGKLMHDAVFERWKDKHARENTFMGNFREYCIEEGLLNEAD